MKIIDKIKSLFASSAEKSRSSDDDGTRFSLFDEYSTSDLKKLSSKSYIEYYKGRSFVAISTIANELGGLGRHVVDNKGKQTTHEYEKLIDFDLLVNIASFMKLAGSCYVWKNKVGSKVQQLVVLRPDRVTLKWDNTGTTLLGYDYQTNDTGSKKFLDKSEVMAFTNFSPMSPYPNNYEGFSDVQAMAMAIDTDYQASKRNRKYFYNNASVPGVLETEQELTEDQVTQIKNSWEQKYRGTNNAHKIGILQGGLKYKPMTPNQKEMDFVESRRFNRDEILGIYKVPKAILGLGEGGQALNVKSFDQMFARRTITPLAKNVEQILNQELFPAGFTFEFVNIIPSDEVEVRNDYVANGITLNEFRASRGYPPLPDGDKLRSQIMYDMIGQVSDPATETPPSEENNNQNSIFRKEDAVINKMIEAAVRKNFKGTDEYRQKKREQKIERNNEYEKLYNAKLQIIFDRQEKEIIKGFKERYPSAKEIGTKAVKPLLNLAKWTAVYYDLLKDPQEKLVKDEGTQALIEVEVTEPLKITPAIDKKLKRNIEKFAGEIDKVTNRKIETVLTNVIDQGLTVNQGVEQLQSVFSDLKTSRAEAIVRTETIRAGNDAAQLGREQSEVVVEKERFTALDERTCEFCGPLHGKRVGLETSFFSKGTVLDGVDENGNVVTMNLDYETVEHPPLHPNCRCAIVPVIK